MNSTKLMIAAVAIVAALLVGINLLGKQASPQTSNSANPINSSSSSATQSNVSVKSFNIVVKNKKIVSGPETIQVNQGDQVKLTFTVDEDEEIHLHGYDKALDVKKDVPASEEFTANLSGSFSFELENSKTDLGVLQVQPK